VSIFASTQQTLFQTLNRSNPARLLTTSYQGVQGFISSGNMLTSELRPGL